MKFYASYELVIRNPNDNTWSHTIIFTMLFRTNRVPNIGERMPLVESNKTMLRWYNCSESNEQNARVVDIQSGFNPLEGSRRYSSKPSVLDTTVYVVGKIFRETPEEAEEMAKKTVEGLKYDPDCLKATEFTGRSIFLHPDVTRC